MTDCDACDILRNELRLAELEINQLRDELFALRAERDLWRNRAELGALRTDPTASDMDGAKRAVDQLEAKSKPAPEAERAWKPIETADRTSSKPVDIWLVPPGKSVSEGYRVPNCRPSMKNAWVNDRSIGGQFITGRYYYDDDGDQCIDPDDVSDEAARATHWMPLPPAPEGEG